MRNYIVLTNSNSTVSKRFFVERNEAFDEPLDKSQSAERTLSGGYDVTYGSIYKSKKYTIRCRGLESDSNYGTKADLEYFYNLNNPNGTPTPRITLEDHLFDETGVAYTVLFTGKLSKRIVTPELSGASAIFRIDTEFLIV
ncbi:MAG TPA: hypothetical protein PKD55_12775 [Bellilinea sp.]|nr:hypothetical protein [Bellilinea sp.]